ncbi:MAG: AbrB/MazE/SpoVT family DNA-binding domain-containing protein [Pseudomonadota bacterium]
MSADGRILVPAALRQAAGLAPGATVIARVEDGRLVLEELQSTVRRMQAKFQEYYRGDGSLVDELIAERREEARREAME